MDLVVELGVADETLGVGLVKLVVQKGDRVHLGLCVAVIDGLRALAVVPPPVAVQAVRVIDRLGRIHPDSAADGVLVGETVVHIHQLAVEIDKKMVVKEARAEVDRDGLTLKVGGLEGTVLVMVADGHAVRHAEDVALPYPAGHGHVAVNGFTQLVDFLLPVGVLLAEGGVGRTSVTEIPFHKVTHLIACQHVHVPCVLADASGEVRAHVDAFGTLGTLLGGDHDDTVGGSRSEDGSRRGVLQDSEALDVVRVDGGKRVGDSADACLGKRQTVNHDERVVVGLQRGTATDSDGAGGTRSAVTHRDDNAGGLALEQIRW